MDGAQSLNSLLGGGLRGAERPYHPVLRSSLWSALPAMVDAVDGALRIADARAALEGFMPESSVSEWDDLQPLGAIVRDDLVLQPEGCLVVLLREPHLARQVSPG